MLFHCFTSACDPGGRRHNLNIFTLESWHPTHESTPSPRAVATPPASAKRLDSRSTESATVKLLQFEQQLNPRTPSPLRRHCCTAALLHCCNTSSTTSRQRHEPSRRRQHPPAPVVQLASSRLHSNFIFKNDYSFLYNLRTSKF